MLILHLIASKEEIWPSTLSEDRPIEFEIEGHDQIDSKYSKNYKKRQTKSKELKRIAKRKPFNKKFNAKVIYNLLTEFRKEENFADSINWLRECFKEIIEEIEDTETENADNEDDNDIPLVPLKSIEKEAIDNVKFQAILEALGIQPPITGSERYWRIPSSFKKNDLEIRLSVLNRDKMSSNGYADEDENNDGNDDLEEEGDNDNDLPDEGDRDYFEEKDGTRYELSSSDDKDVDNDIEENSDQEKGNGNNPEDFESGNSPIMQEKSFEGLFNEAYIWNVKYICHLIC